LEHTTKAPSHPESFRSAADEEEEEEDDDDDEDVKDNDEDDSCCLGFGKRMVVAALSLSVGSWSVSDTDNQDDRLSLALLLLLETLPVTPPPSFVLMMATGGTKIVTPTSNCKGVPATEPPRLGC
jgi:hypothetical protein